MFISELRELINSFFKKAINP